MHSSTASRPPERVDARRAGARRSVRTPSSPEHAAARHRRTEAKRDRFGARRRSSRHRIAIGDRNLGQARRKAAASTGSLRRRLPVAAKIALVTAGGMTEVPPRRSRRAARGSRRCAPRSPAPRRCAAAGRCRNCACSTRPRLSVISPYSAAVTPNMIAPSICARTVSGLTAVPQSTAQTTRRTRTAPLPGDLDLGDHRHVGAEHGLQRHAAAACPAAAAVPSRPPWRRDRARLSRAGSCRAAPADRRPDPAWRRPPARRRSFRSRTRCATARRCARTRSECPAARPARYSTWKFGSA